MEPQFLIIMMVITILVFSAKALPLCDVNQDNKQNKRFPTKLTISCEEHIIMPGGNKCSAEPITSLFVNRHFLKLKCIT